jgi:hypothetical protein
MAGSVGAMASVSGSAVGSSPEAGCTFSSGPDGFDI